MQFTLVSTLNGGVAHSSQVLLIHTTMSMHWMLSILESTSSAKNLSLVTVGNYVLSLLPQKKKVYSSWKRCGRDFNPLHWK